jgi:hypothetical protein
MSIGSLFSSAVESFRKLDLDKQLLMFAGGLYITGALITTTFLLIIGAPSVELLRVRYITTGMLFVVFISLILVPVSTFTIVLFRGLNKSNVVGKVWSASIALLEIIPGMFFIALLLAIVSRQGVFVQGNFNPDLTRGWGKFFSSILIIDLLMILVLILLAFAIGFVPLIGREFADQASVPSPTETEPIDRVRDFVVVVLMFLILLLYYISSIYPEIPIELGGGAPQKVQVVVSKDGLKPLLADPGQSVYLLDSTESRYVFLVTTSAQPTDSADPTTTRNIVTVSKDDLDAVVSK